LNKNKKLRKQNKKIYLEKVSIPYRDFAYSYSVLFFCFENVSHFIFIFERVRKVERFLPFCVFLCVFHHNTNHHLIETLIVFPSFSSQQNRFALVSTSEI